MPVCQWHEAYTALTVERKGSKRRLSVMNSHRSKCMYWPHNNVCRHDRKPQARRNGFQRRPKDTNLRQLITDIEAKENLNKIKANSTDDTTKWRSVNIFQYNHFFISNFFFFVLAQTPSSPVNSCHSHRNTCTPRNRNIFSKTFFYHKLLYGTTLDECRPHPRQTAFCEPFGSKVRAQNFYCVVLHRSFRIYVDNKLKPTKKSRMR